MILDGDGTSRARFCPRFAGDEGDADTDDSVDDNNDGLPDGNGDGFWRKVSAVDEGADDPCSISCLTVIEDDDFLMTVVVVLCVCSLVFGGVNSFC